MNAQLIIFLDKQGNFHAEMPGQNGARVKVYLGENFRERNPEIAVALTEKQADLDALTARITLAKKADYIDPQIERDRKNAELREENLAKRQAWLDSLPRDRRELEEAKLEKARLRALEESNARARGLYHYVASAHDIHLAARVITDPSRRPKRKIAVQRADGSIIMATPAEIHGTNTKERAKKEKFANIQILDL